MINGIFSQHLGSLEQALDRTSTRQTLLMSNMANVNVPGYKRKDIDFRSALAGETAKQHQLELADQRAQELSDQTSLRVDGNNVNLEMESISISETQLRYSALAQITSAYFGELKFAIREGK